MAVALADTVGSKPPKRLALLSGSLPGSKNSPRFSLHPLDESFVRQAQEARATIIGRWEAPG